MTGRWGTGVSRHPIALYSNYLTLDEKFVILFCDQEV